MIEKLKGILIDDWKRAWKFLTVWLAGALVAIDSAHDSLPLVKEYLPDGWVKYIAAAIIVARLIKQAREKV
ncbi:holin [Ralstonia phage BOESR1]|uniref:Holin n=1 Tax=Ralstonia phage BOESR1 TaxID=3034917 RepID=A0AA50IHG9_9CAUD|nr:holin [Ralstonia phage BOESR1]WLW40606.1 holin [Ralstonia phage BOESR1]